MHIGWDPKGVTDATGEENQTANRPAFVPERSLNMLPRCPEERGGYETTESADAAKDVPLYGPWVIMHYASIIDHRLPVIGRRTLRI